MTLKGYLNFVEIQTKIASLIPFLFGSIYSIYKYGKVNVVNLIIMFISMICFDMATTAINNYCDYKNEIKHSNGKYIGRNPMFVNNISKRTGLTVIYILLFIAILFGIILAVRTNLLVLFLGGICFFIGIFYTFGPIPISRMPLGEVFSGIFMGFIITFLTIYINIVDLGYFGMYVINGEFIAKINLVEASNIFLVSIPLITGIANIMLSNNICDLEDDKKVSRFTLPYYIGKDFAIKLYKILYYFGYFAIFISIILKVLPITSVIVFLTIPFINKNIKKFEEKQVKSETFVLAVKNFIIINSIYIIELIGNLIFLKILDI
ncbi:1,4-dihydroxy-2-naphthoate polyprenyltransferase [Clostridium sp. Ade.TY]|uniref:1,4-dihydroxy-2-naphthoate polyprenyltransferase n=1 Tax=Clostridium sp. Ade.TY TaxID=1391647 RepID=UPI00041D98E7|nr:1,4-dihydroxy-2-naphthoate polyprenyltransferase [Clostridium sp. Ade.TY]